MRLLPACLIAMTVFVTPVYSQVYGRPKLLQNVGIDQKMGARIPLDLKFADELGRPVTIGRYLGKPIILALVYYTCPSLCNTVLRGLARSLQGMSLIAGRDFEVVAVSFDPRENYSAAGTKKESVLREFGDTNSDSGWHFLTGSEGASKQLASSVGFRYAYDAGTNQYVHPGCIMILTPEGRVTRYFYGITYQPRDIKLGLVEATDGRIGTPMDQVLLYCFHYDPANGKYGLVIMNVLRAGALATLGALAAFLWITLRQDRYASGRRGAEE